MSVLRRPGPPHPVTGSPINFDHICGTCRWFEKERKRTRTTCRQEPAQPFPDGEVPQSLPGCQSWERSS